MRSVLPDPQNLQRNLQRFLQYAWAERAKKAGYPERFAQEALGHNSKAIHRAYARRAQVELPPLSEFERMRTKFAEMSKTIEPVMASAYPERFAQAALGHNSKAVHRAYAKRALMKLPPLEDYEQRAVTKAESAA